MPNSRLLDEPDDQPGPIGHDTRSLGPSDTSDSGSDVAEQASTIENPELPVDAAIDPERPHSGPSFESLAPGDDADSTGTGERASAAGDIERGSGVDVRTDHVDPTGSADDALDAESRQTARPSRP
jgi:hypothetical protein